MAGKISSNEINDILKVLLQAINSAEQINKDIKEDSVKNEIKNFLKSVEDTTIKFFKENIDRRKEAREKPIMKDMMDYYKIKSSYL
jgi:hypothetical protein